MPAGCSDCSSLLISMEGKAVAGVSDLNLVTAFSSSSFLTGFSK
jgi:hypothetical protein